MTTGDRWAKQRRSVPTMHHRLLPHTTSEVSVPRQAVCSAASDITGAYTHAAAAALASSTRVHLSSASISPFIIACLKKDTALFEVTQVHCGLFLVDILRSKECLEKPPRRIYLLHLL